MQTRENLQMPQYKKYKTAKEKKKKTEKAPIKRDFFLFITGS
jgi:hypothetical protein